MNMRSGKGRLILADGGYVYDGNWKDDQKSGIGIEYYMFHKFYQGNWREDAYHGNGTIYWENGDSFAG